MQIKELGHIVLYVTDLSRAVSFYRDTLGFRLVAETFGAAVFSSGRTHHEFLLIGIGGEKKKRSGVIEPGLYHTGFKVGDGSGALREVYRELKAKGISIIGSADHGVTHSLYLLDPDGNELELYADVSEEWRKDPSIIMQPVKPLVL